jgi:hypothetical protein
MGGDEGARQSDFGRRHFGLLVCQPPPLGEALGTDPVGLLLVQNTVAGEEQSGCCVLPPEENGPETYR